MREHRCKHMWCFIFLLHSVRPWWLPLTWQVENRAEWNFLFPFFFFCPPLSLFFWVNFSFGSCARTAMPDFNRCKFDMRAHPAASPWNLCFCDPSTPLPLLTCQKHLPSVRSNPRMSSKNIVCVSFIVFGMFLFSCIQRWSEVFGTQMSTCTLTGHKAFVAWQVNQVTIGFDCRPVQIDRAGGKRNSKI